MNRRCAIKKMIITAVSFTIGMPLVLEFLFNTNHADNHANETFGTVSKISPDEILSKTIDENFKNGEVIDFVLIAMILEEKGQLEAVGGYPYLMSVANTYDEADFIA